jgi:hypothetical protein
MTCTHHTDNFKGVVRTMLAEHATAVVVTLRGQRYILSLELDKDAAVRGTCTQIDCPQAGRYYDQHAINSLQIPGPHGIDRRVQSAPVTAAEVHADLHADVKQLDDSMRKTADEWWAAEQIRRAAKP